jgi:hypothetical protein
MENNRQYRSNQGRSPEKQAQVEKIAFIGGLGLIATIIVTIIYNILNPQ